MPSSTRNLSLTTPKVHDMRRPAIARVNVDSGPGPGCSESWRSLQAALKLDLNHGTRSASLKSGPSMRGTQYQLRAPR